MAEHLSRRQPRPVARPGHRAAVQEAALTGDWRLLVLQPAAGRRRQDAGCRTGLLRASPSCLLRWQLASLPLAASTAAETARENGMRTPTASRAAVGRGLHEWTWGGSHKALSPPHNSVIFRKIQWRSYWAVTRDLISQGKLSGCRIHSRVPRQTSVSIAAAFPAPRPSSQHSQSLGVDVLPQEQRMDTQGQGTQAWEPWRLWDPSPRSLPPATSSPSAVFEALQGAHGAMASALEGGSARASHATFAVVSLVLSRAYWQPHLCLWTNHTPLFVTKVRRGQGAAIANEASPKAIKKSRWIAGAWGCAERPPTCWWGPGSPVQVAQHGIKGVRTLGTEVTPERCRDFWHMLRRKGCPWP